jgi:hypothetical protein
MFSSKTTPIWIPYPGKIREEKDLYLAYHVNDDFGKALDDDEQRVAHEHNAEQDAPFAEAAALKVLDAEFMKGVG